MEPINNAFSQSSLTVPIPCEGFNYFQSLISLIEDQNCKKSGQQTTQFVKYVAKHKHNQKSIIYTTS
jgi:hypothetical protein